MTIDLSSDSPTTSISVSEGASQTNFTVSFKFNNAADLNVFVDGTQKADNTISLVLAAMLEIFDITYLIDALSVISVFISLSIVSTEGTSLAI